MNKAINSIVNNILDRDNNFTISFGNNWNLEEVSGDLGIAFYSRSVILPKGVKENPFKK